MGLGNFAEAKSRFTVRGFEQQLTGEEHFAATPREATLRLLRCMAERRGLMVAVGDSAQAFLQAPIVEKEDIWV